MKSVLVSAISILILAVSCTGPLATTQANLPSTVSSKNLEATFVAGAVRIVDSETHEIVAVDDDTQAMLADIFANGSSVETVLFTFSPSNRADRAVDHMHSFTAKVKFLTTHSVAVKRPDPSVYYDTYTCYVYSYLYTCEFCGANGGSFITHSYPHK